FLLPVGTALDDIPALALTETEAAALGNGQALSLVQFMGRIHPSCDPNGGLARLMASGRFVALGRLGDGLLRPERVL
ncbi:MAG: tRNA pseudouridine(55) synthase TruB, partial [Acidiphilium sp. 37-67-22]